jgi:glycosyltransferase involved in cell wall biosynthesis
MPDVSVIVATYNSQNTIERCLESLARQQGVEYQCILVDGASSDQTLERIKRFDFIDTLISEPDSGISDAWNKGLDCIKGDYVLFLNSDDELPEEYLKSRVEHIRGLDNVITYSDTLYYPSVGFPEIRQGYFEPHKQKFKMKFGFLHTSCVFPASLFEKFRFPLSIVIAIDIDQMLFAYRNGYTYTKAEGYNIMYAGGISDTQWIKGSDEYVDLFAKHGVISRGSIPMYKALVRVRFVFVKLKLFKMFKSFTKYLDHFALGAGNFVRNNSAWLVRRWLQARFGWTVSPTSKISRGCKIFSFGKLQVGENTKIDKDVYLDNRAGIRLGNQVSIAHGCRIYSRGHAFDSPIFESWGAYIDIGDYSVLCANTQIMPGVSVGEGAVVLPGSVVYDDVEPYAVVGGNPAVIKRYRKKELNYSPLA